MNRKKGLFAVVAALAISSVMAAMAYTHAEVTNPATMQVTNSAKAYLRVYPSFHTNNPEVGYKDVNVFEDKDGIFKFDFTKGAHGVGATGFQPGSKYEFDQLFCVFNESKDSIQYWVTTDIPYITIKAGDTVLVDNGKTTGKKVSIGTSAGTWYLDVSFDVPKDAAAAHALNTLVKGEVKVFAEPIK